jgi:hypothetical protein
MLDTSFLITALKIVMSEKPGKNPKPNHDETDSRSLMAPPQAA